MVKKKRIIYHKPPMKFNPALQKFEVDLRVKTKLKKEIESSYDKRNTLSIIFWIILILFLAIAFIILKKVVI
jgi:hypothetical protein